MEKAVLSIREFMEALGIDKNKAFEIIKRGEIQAFRIGKDYKIPRIAVEDYLKQQGDNNM